MGLALKFRTITVLFIFSLIPVGTVFIDGNSLNHSLTENWSESVADYTPRSLFSTMDYDSFYTWIHHLSETIGVRDLNSGNNERAKQWIKTMFESFDLNVTVIGGHESVVGILKGSSASDKVVVLGAHFDTVPTTKGANDNAGGIGLILEAAKLISSQQIKPYYDIYFTAYNGEEVGLYGSFEFVNHLESLNKSVIVSVNADMILYDDPQREVTEKQPIYYKGKNVLQDEPKYEHWANLTARISDVLGSGYLTAEPAGTNDDFSLHSDHGAFWLANFPAIFAHSGRDSFYHLPGDTLDNPELNLTYALETVVSSTTLAYISAQYGTSVLETTLDADGDGLDNQLEYIIGTDPTNADTDSDSISDKEEYVNQFDPLNSSIPYSTSSVISTSSITSQSTDKSSSSLDTQTSSWDYVIGVSALASIVMLLKKKRY